VGGVAHEEGVAAPEALGQLGGEGEGPDPLDPRIQPGDPRTELDAPPDGLLADLEAEPTAGLR
jgi:hypothetical protein